MAWLDRLVGHLTSRGAARRRLTLLASAGEALLDASQDYDAVLERIATLPVPVLADFTCLHIAEPDGTLRAASAAGVDTAAASRLLAAARAQTRGDAGARGVVAAIRTGRVETAADASSPAIFVPLHGRGATLGALSLYRTDRRRVFAAADVALAEELAARCVMALDIAAATREARAAMEIRDRLLRLLGHELRTPLTAIIASAHLLGRPRDPTAQARTIETIVRSAETQRRLIDDVLDAARILSGTSEFNPTVVKLGAIVRTVVDSFRPLADDGRITLDIADEGEPAMICGDEARLHQALGNLIANALEFTPAGGRVTVEIASNAWDARISVEDTGAGIPAERVPHVFEPFYQAGPAGRRERLGLGLAITRHLITLHGGRITCASDGTGRGSRFTVTLPRLPASSEAVPGRPCAVEGPPTA